MDIFEKSFQYGGTPVNAQDYLLSAYREPHRHYHNLDHIEQMLELVSQTLWWGDGQLQRKPTSVLLNAIWFHDCVYDPTAMDNEEQSAAMAALYLDQSISRDVQDLILLSKRHQFGTFSVPNIFVLADLVIFTKPLDVFSQYCFNVREEYRHVDDATYAKKRLTFLCGVRNRWGHGIRATCQYNLLQDRYDMSENFEQNMDWEIDRLFSLTV